MKPFHRFSFSFDPDLLKKDLSIANQQWISHFNTAYYTGDWSGIPLIKHENSIHPLGTGTPGTKPEVSPMLKALPYFSEVLSFFECEISMARLLKLSPGSIIKEHTDRDLSYWNDIIRIHIPITTNEKVTFMLDGNHLSMRPGECWFAEFCLPHAVSNQGLSDRVHLVLDFELNDWMKNLFEKEQIVSANEKRPTAMDRYDDRTRLQIIDNLRRMGTVSALEEADYLTRKYNLAE